PEIERQGIPVDDRPKVRMRVKRVQLRCKKNRLSGPAPVERLHSHAVADKVQLLPLAIPERDREHADEPPNRRRDSPRLECSEEDFRIGVPAEVRSQASFDELLTDRLEVIDLTVEND